MTAQQFNEKYKDFLENGYYGLSFDEPELTIKLDKKFQEFIQRPGFKYKQIKVKFGMGRFYAEQVSREEIIEIEHNITNYFKKLNHSA